MSKYLDIRLSPKNFRLALIVRLRGRRRAERDGNPRVTLFGAPLDPNGMASPYSDGIGYARLELGHVQSMRGGHSMKVTAVGVDLAKSVFLIHGVDERGPSLL